MSRRNPTPRTPPVALVLVACGLLGLLLARSATAARLGVMGDSLSDEYAEAPYGSYAQNWVEQLVVHGGHDAGPTATEAAQPGGTWGEPRRTGYAYNWARAGATSDTLLSGGQHSGLAGQVAAEGIAYAILAIGANDFSPAREAYASIYAGAWSPAQIDAYLSQRLANIDAALDAVLPTGVQLVLATVPDYGLTPSVRAAYPDPLGRQAVSDVIQQLNASIDAIAQTRQLPLVDIFGASLAIFGPHAGPNPTLTLGNVDLDLLAADTPAGGNPTAAFVHDGIHPNTTLQGILANTFLAALNIGYGAGLALFSEAEILAHRGLAYGGADTLAAQIGDYADYVVNHAPPLPECDDGLDNDGDGRADHPSDPGCADAADLSERSPLLACDDGADNDADGWADYPADPGCRDPAWIKEDPQCQDGLDNDGESGTDFDGGASVPPHTVDPEGADPQCTSAWKDWEKFRRRCGLGFELALLLPPLARLRRRLRRSPYTRGPGPSGDRPGAPPAPLPPAGSAECRLADSGREPGAHLAP